MIRLFLSTLFAIQVWAQQKEARSRDWQVETYITQEQSAVNGIVFDELAIALGPLVIRPKSRIALFLGEHMVYIARVLKVREALCVLFPLAMLTGDVSCPSMCANRTLSFTTKKFCPRYRRRGRTRLSRRPEKKRRRQFLQKQFLQQQSLQRRLSTKRRILSWRGRSRTTLKRRDASSGGTDFLDLLAMRKKGQALYLLPYALWQLSHLNFISVCIFLSTSIYMLALRI